MTVDAKNFANLHAHSTHSDGIYTPAELVQVGFDEGYGALVLTDHDTVSGNGEMMDACNRRGFSAEKQVQQGEPKIPNAKAFGILLFC